MYKIRLSVFRKYTFAAAKGLTPSTVPEALANPATSEAFFGSALAIFKSAATPNRATPITNKPFKLNCRTFLFISISSTDSHPNHESESRIADFPAPTSYQRSKINSQRSPMFQGSFYSRGTTGNPTEIPISAKARRTEFTQRLQIFHQILNKAGRPG